MSSITPQHLVQQLSPHQQAPFLPTELIQLLTETIQHLRVQPASKTAYSSSQELWSVLKSVWDSHATALETTGDEVSNKLETIDSLQSLAALLVTLCGGTPSNQVEAVKHLEPQLVRVLLICSSFHNLQDDSYKDLTRTACQALANLITGNDKLASSYLPARLQLEEKDHLIHRLLASTDHSTLQALLIFLLNSIHSSPSRANFLATSKSGSTILDQVLLIVALLFEEEEEEAIKKEEFANAVFGVSFALVRQIIELGAFPAAYAAQASLDPTFLLSPAQTTLLKLLDGYLYLPLTPLLPSSLSLIPFLLSLLTSLSTNLISPTREKGVGDAMTFQASVLTLLCLSSLGLVDGDERGRKEMGTSVLDVVALLRYSNTLSERRLTELSSSSQEPITIEPEAVSLLKRSCVRLLGILSFEQKSAQDEIRESGGLNLLLEMCQINDANITLREHALFAVRNVLKENQENQDLVEGMTPQYLVGPSGELQDLPPALRDN